MNMAEPLKILCIKNGLTMAETARRLGCSPQALSQKLKRGTFSLRDLDDIAVVSGCRLECSFVLPGGERIPIIKEAAYDD